MNNQETNIIGTTEPIGPLDLAEEVLALSMRVTEVVEKLEGLSKSRIWNQIKDKGYSDRMLSRVAYCLIEASSGLSNTGAFLSGYVLSNIQQGEQGQNEPEKSDIESRSEIIH